MWLILLVFAVSLFYYLIQRNYNYWSRNGIPGPKPLPLFGNFWDVVFGNRAIGQLFTDCYNKYKDYPVVGLYRFTTPILLIRDPEMIKNIVVKDFKYFSDNDVYADQDIDPIMGRNPFFMKGSDWKNKRAQLTPCFTSGKIKGMYPLLERNSIRMVKYIEDELKSLKTLEAREVCIRLTLDNVAACAFGIEGKSFDEQYSDFREMADQFLSPEHFFSKIKFFIAFALPNITKYIKFKLIAEQVENRLIGIVRASMAHRRENNIVKNDFLDGCTNLSTEKGLFTEMDIVAHAASFFGDGYETSSRTMSFVLFNLAENPDVQNKLREELNESWVKNGNKFTYDSIHASHYLEACLSESLRKHSTLSHLPKVCTEDYIYTSTNPDFKSLTVNLKKGDPIILPIWGLHADSKYYMDPEKFIPERFLDKSSINKYTYLPFGEGQRVCLGQRFATTQIKVGIAYIIKHYRLSINSKTQLPLKFDPYYFMLNPIGGLWLNWEKM